MLLKFLVFLSVSSLSLAAPGPYAKRNVIFMVSDGTGLATHTMARQYLNATQGIQTTTLDSILVGVSSTSSASHIITDSAAGATAFACGKLTTNYYVGMTPDGKPCGTLLEAAKATGMKTGLVVTSSITDATPASFASHAIDRGLEDSIASQLVGEGALGRTVDLMFGGGKKFFTSKGRKDGRDLIADSKKLGWRYVENKQSFDRLNGYSALPLYGLFADMELDYNVDRDPTKQPSLSEMTKKSLEILKTATAQSNKGFFLMVEGSMIDRAAHLNDPVGHISEIVEYNKAVKVVKDFIDRNPDTIMLSVSDHETGGLVLGREGFFDGKRKTPDWKPSVIKRSKISALAAGQKILDFKGNKAARKDFIKNELLGQAFNVQSVSDEELELANKDEKTEIAYAEKIATIVSKEANVAWTTHSHSAIDVPLFAYGKGTQALRGHKFHVQLTDFVAQHLGLNLRAITNKLNTKKQ